MNILLVDDVKSNLGVLNLHIDEWFKANDFDIDDINIEEAHNGKDALDKITDKYYDIVFLDIMMPIMTGIETLDHLSRSTVITLPNIIMQTALDSADMELQAKNLGAKAYVTKPIKYSSIEIMLDTYLKDILLKDNSDEDIIEESSDDFDDFNDFEDFDEFESDEIDKQKDMMNKFNMSHKKITSQEFLEDYPDLDYILEDVMDIENDLSHAIDTLDEDNLMENIILLEDVLEKYSRFLNTFLDFYELATSLNILVKVLTHSDIASLDQKSRKFIAGLLAATLNDLRDWKDHVFIDKDAVDVFYINASSLSTCIQLESYIKKKLNK